MVGGDERLVEELGERLEQLGAPRLVLDLAARGERLAPVLRAHDHVAIGQLRDHLVRRQALEERDRTRDRV